MRLARRVALRVARPQPPGSCRQRLTNRLPPSRAARQARQARRCSQATRRRSPRRFPLGLHVPSFSVRPHCAQESAERYLFRGERYFLRRRVVVAIAVIVLSKGVTGKRSGDRSSANLWLEKIRKFECMVQLRPITSFCTR